MIETKMPKDIRAYKTKIFGPLTTRQAICVAIMGVVDVILYLNIMSPMNAPMEVWFFVFFMVDVAIGLFGWVEPMGMTMEKYIAYILKYIFIIPAKRKVSCNIWKLPNENKKNKKKHPDKKGFE